MYTQGRCGWGGVLSDVIFPSHQARADTQLCCVAGSHELSQEGKGNLIPGGLQVAGLVAQSQLGHAASSLPIS